MTDIKSIDAGKYNSKLAEALKSVEEFKKPEWVDFVKTGTNRMRPTTEPDFWQKRTASILRQFYIRGIIGVERLRTRYGGRKDKGMQPARFHKSSGKIIRVILQQAESAGFMEKSNSKKVGRQLTKKGKDFLESVKI